MALCLLWQRAFCGWEFSRALYTMLSPSRKGAMINSTITAFLNRPNREGSRAIVKSILTAHKPLPKGSQINVTTSLKARHLFSENSYLIK